MNQALNKPVIDWTHGTVGGTQLRPQSLAVLKLLHENAGQVVSKDQIMAAVWPGVAVTDDSLVQCITEIRKALGDAGRALIKTLAKRGYMYKGPAAAARAIIATEPVELPAIAVLPFTNLSDDPKGDKFADMMTEDVITDLSHSKDFAVIARNSTQVYKDKAVDVRDVGRELNVQYVLEGSVQPMPGKVRATAQLIDAETGRHIWSERFEKQGEDVFAIEEEIVALIATSIMGYGRVATTAVRNIIRRLPPQGWNAYDAYQMGLEALEFFDPKAFDKADELFAMAIRLDPNFARVYVKRAWVAFKRVDFGMIPASVGLPLMLEYARKAEALDPQDAEAQAVLSSYYEFMGNSDSSLLHAERALSFAPNSADTLLQTAWPLYSNNQAERVLRNVERAVRLNPRHPHWWNGILLDAFFWCREYKRAYEFGKLDTHRTPIGKMMLTISASQLGKAAEAASARAELLAEMPDFSLERLQSVYGKFWMGDKFDYLVAIATAAGLRICMTEAERAAHPDIAPLPICDVERAKEK